MKKEGRIQFLASRGSGCRRSLSCLERSGVTNLYMSKAISNIHKFSYILFLMEFLTPECVGESLLINLGLQRGFIRQNQTRLEDPYVDGISITYGQNKRKHIWTFAVERNRANSGTCPCSTNIRIVTPHFINEDYFCERGTTSDAGSVRLFDNNPLWDGYGCTGFSTCCEFNNPPWFCKQLPEPTAEDIDIRMMSSVGGPNSLEDEDTPVQLTEIFVQ